MSGKYIDLTDRIGEGAEYSNTTSFCLGIECALRWLDEHSDQAPGRTITESRYRALTDSDPEEYRSGFSDGFFFAGGCIVPEPEPTNAEKLEALLEGDNINAQWALRGGGVMFARELAHALDDAGVKAPGGDENTDRGHAWWIENANVTDAEDCEACGEAEDLCPVHHGMAVGVEFVTQKIAALGDDPELFNRIPSPPKAPGGDE